MDKLLLKAVDSTVKIQVKTADEKIAIVDWIVKVKRDSLNRDTGIILITKRKMS